MAQQNEKPVIDLKVDSGTGQIVGELNLNSVLDINVLGNKIIENNINYITSMTIYKNEEYQLHKEWSKSFDYMQEERIETLFTEEDMEMNGDIYIQYVNYFAKELYDCIKQKSTCNLTIIFIYARLTCVRKETDWMAFKTAFEQHNINRTEFIESVITRMEALDATNTNQFMQNGKVNVEFKNIGGQYFLQGSYTKNK